MCSEEAVRVTELVPRNMTQFRFEQEILTNGSVVAVQCVVCGQVGHACTTSDNSNNSHDVKPRDESSMSMFQEGHLASSCPEEQLPELAALAPLPQPYLKMLSQVCEEVARDWEPQHQELRSAFSLDRKYLIS